MNDLVTTAFDFNPLYDIWWVVGLALVGATLTYVFGKAGRDEDAVFTMVVTVLASALGLVIYLSSGTVTDEEMLRADITSQLEISSVVLEDDTWFAGKIEDGSFVRCGLLESNRTNEGLVFAVICDND